MSRISKASQKSGVAKKTIRYYEEIGMIPPLQRMATQNERFSQEEVEADVRQARKQV